MTTNFAEHLQELKTAVEITVPDGIQNVGNGVFSNYVYLKRLWLPESIQSIGNSAFSGCLNLGNFKLPSSLQSIGDGAFSACCSLTKIHIPKTVTKIGDYAFAECTDLHDIYFSTMDIEFGDKVFDKCENLLIHCAFGSSAMNYAVREQLEFVIDVISVGNVLIPTFYSHDLSGDGWKWDAQKKILSLVGYDGGAIIAGDDLTINLSPASENYLSPAKSNVMHCGIISIDGNITISGTGKLTIDKFEIGMFAEDSLKIISGEISSFGGKYGILVNRGNTDIAGGTVSAASVNPDVHYPAISGKLRTGDGRIFVGELKDTPHLVPYYANQQYVCVTYDESYNPAPPKILHQTIYNVGDVAENAQVVTGDNNGTIIGSDNLINRSEINNANCSKNEDKPNPVNIGSDCVINRTVIGNNMPDGEMISNSEVMHDAD